MNLNIIKNKIAGALLGTSMILGIGFVSATNTQAQWQSNDRYQTQREREREQRRREEARRARQQQRRGGYGNNGGYYGRSSDGYSNLGGSFQLRQTALNEGFNEGLKEGRRDRSRGEGFNFTDESAFREATTDYSSKLGDRELYRRYFRESFENGYKDGYAGY